MPKATLSFSIPEEQDDFKDAMNGWRYRNQVEEIWNKVFRPYYKHGYSDQELNKLLSSPEGGIIIDKLAELYIEVINDND